MDLRAVDELTNPKNVRVRVRARTLIRVQAKIQARYQAKFQARTMCDEQGNYPEPEPTTFERHQECNPDSGAKHSKTYRRP